MYNTNKNALKLEHNVTFFSVDLETYVRWYVI